MKREHRRMIKRVAHHHAEVGELIKTLKPIFGRDVFDGGLFEKAFAMLDDYRDAASEAVGDSKHWLEAFLVDGCRSGAINGESVEINTLDDLCRVIDMQKEAQNEKE